MTRFARLAPAGAGRTIVPQPRGRRFQLSAALSWPLVLRNSTRIAALVLGLAATGLMPSGARAEDKLALTLKDHVFIPAELTVPAGKAFSIEVTNEDATAEEFDSDDLHVEKVIAAKSSGTIHIKPLKPGSYKFDGEYHDATAKGVLIAK
ncbi:MAG: cupredoxin domain-containing protein [Ancalomicrobiaceae bacterium]|nr:cupredoxin domain-containing protein [Ancalomicrobiaceae bacterium]